MFNELKNTNMKTFEMTLEQIQLVDRALFTAMMSLTDAAMKNPNLHKAFMDERKEMDELRKLIFKSINSK